MANKFQPSDSDRFAAALRRFDEQNAKDPNVERWMGAPEPRELVYARCLTEWILKLCPEASEELRLAARSQHLRRWEIPRERFPITRPGYLRWREALKQFHADQAGEVLAAVGYLPPVVARVRELILKKTFPEDPESRTLEDALCLLFLERQFPALAAQTSEEKILNALRKSWKKMTPRARELALELPYGPQEKSLLQRALREET